MSQGMCRGYRTAQGMTEGQRKPLERGATEGESPVCEGPRSQERHLSRPEHEEFRLNCRGPSRKAKHYRETDSEPVL